MYNNLIEYKAAVKRLADTQDSFIFNNHGVEHAVIVNSEIFNQSIHQVNIYANKMSGSISTHPDYLSAMKDFMMRGGKVNVIVKDSSLLKKPKDGNSFTSAYNKIILQSPSLESNIEFKEASDGFMQSIDTVLMLDKNPLKNIFFTVGDNKMFRVETDNNSHSAFVSFNNIKVSNALNNVFNNYFISNNVPKLEIK